MLVIYIDADACAVKDEIYKVADRYQLKVFVVANQYIKIPMNINIQMQVVPEGPDAADDWIAEQIQSGDILITSDLLLAERAIQSQARVLGPKGNELDAENIGSILASRELNSQLRDMGNSTGGPAPMAKNDRSKFLSKLDQIIQALLKYSRR